MTRATSCLVATCFALSLLSAPVKAQETEGLNLMEEGAKLFFKGLMDEMEPALDELETLMRDAQPMMRDFVTEMGPALKDMLEEVEDWSVYHPPEILPNGDIIIRRKAERGPIAPEDAPDSTPRPRAPKIDL